MSVESNEGHSGRPRGLREIVDARKAAAAAKEDAVAADRPTQEQMDRLNQLIAKFGLRFTEDLQETRTRTWADDTIAILERKLERLEIEAAAAAKRAASPQCRSRGIEM